MLHNPEVLFGDELLLSQPVETFRSASQDKDPLLYPGERPRGSFVTDGAVVTSLYARREDEGGLRFSIAAPGGVAELNDYLAVHGAAPIEDRVPVLAYGANMSPGSLRTKFDKVGRPDALIVPTVYAELPGHDVVWSAGPGMLGNFIASLYSGPETVDSSVQVGVSFLTREQLLVLHATELAYDLHRVETEIDGVNLPAYYYAGRDEIYVEDGAPVAIESVPAKGRSLTAGSTSDMLERLLRNNSVMQQVRDRQPGFPEGSIEPRGYVEYVKSLRKNPENPTPRGDFKKLIHATLEANGLSRTTASPDDEVMSWANPSTLPTYGEWLQGADHSHIYVLPTSELPKDAWPDPEARAKVLRGVSEHFARQLPKGGPDNQS